MGAIIDNYLIFVRAVIGIIDQSHVYVFIQHFSGQGVSVLIYFSSVEASPLELNAHKIPT